MSMKTIHGIDQLVKLGTELDENQSMPCVLIAPELLQYAVKQVDVTIEEADVAGSPGVIEFLPEPKEVDVVSAGIRREIDVATGNTFYADIVDGYIACGVTRVSPEEFDWAKERVESEDFGQVEISRFADGDLFRFFVHKTKFGPGVVIDVLTEKILPEITPPRIALNPFSSTGWKYMLSLFETGAFFWSVTDGDRAFILVSIQHFYPALVSRVHNRCLQFNTGIKTKNWNKALRDLRKQLK